MGRQLKRVALDFVWPLDKVWEGFINPHYTATPCPDCENGYAPVAQQLCNQWYGQAPFRPEDRGSKPFTVGEIWDDIETKVKRSNYWPHTDEAILGECRRMLAYYNTQWCHHLNQDDVNALVKGGRLYDFTQKWTKEKGWKPKKPAYKPTAREVNLWSLSGFGHDSINQHVVVSAECKRLGIPSTCPTCKGSHGIWPSKEAKRKYDCWKKIEPPKGEGYQIWETVSEGSPITPVFKTPEELARYAAENPWGASVATYESWMKFILGDGWSPSFVTSAKGLQSGVTFVAENSPPKDATA